MLKFLGLVALLLLAATSAIGAPPPAGFVKEDTEFKSGTEDTMIRVYRDSSDPIGAMQFRVFGKGIRDPDGYLLWEGANRASAKLSFDGEAIAVSNHVTSDFGQLFVFTRCQDGSYQRIDLDFQKEALKAFTKQLGLKGEPAFDHIYCYAEAWLTDHQFLGVLSGHMSGEYSLDAFWFLFDCATRQLSFDLREINKTTFHKTKKESAK